MNTIISLRANICSENNLTFFMRLRDLLEYLAPFIFVLLWVFGGPLEGKEGKRRNKECEADKRRKRAQKTNRENSGRPDCPPSALEKMLGIDMEEETMMPKEPTMPMQFKKLIPQEPQQQVAEALRDYEAELKEQERRIKEAKEKARSVTVARVPDNFAYKHKKNTPLTLKPFANELIEMLKTPYATKKAIMSHETLGTPVGMRKRGQMDRSWDS